MTRLLDRFGQPIQRAALTMEIAAPTITGVRSPLSGSPADGLDPVRLGHILREADRGDAVRYLELAETIEERDGHYLGVLGTRRRSVAQLDISVEPASDKPEDVRRADLVRDWLKRDELAEELFDILDAVGKGYSFTEIIWDTSSGQWQPARLEWRDPRWFRFHRTDLATPQLLGETGEPQPLPGAKFIFARIKAKSGLALRSGLARIAAWSWMFKAYTNRDWAIFSQTYGQPLRLGKYHPGASERDKETLFTAVANIAGDCAAIVPESMSIEFVEAGNVGASADLYEKRANWIDQQMSKAVLGQTATTDAIAGGHAVGQEHREVQEDIETSDAKALSSIVNRDLIRPWMDLEFGPSDAYPRVRIARPKTEDISRLSAALAQLIPVGLEVEEAEVRSKLGLSEPKPGAKLLTIAAPRPAPTSPEPDEAEEGAAGPAEADDADASAKTPPFERESSKFERGTEAKRPGLALHANLPSTGLPEALASEGEFAPEVVLADQLEAEARPALDAWIGRVEAMVEAAGSLDELKAMMMAATPDLDAAALTRTLAVAMLAAELGGRASVASEDG